MSFYLIDFEDSFTYNIAAEFVEVGVQCQVLNYKTLHDKIFFKHLKTKDALILGPGPGHPSHYQLDVILQDELIKKKRRVAGICLGHQLLSIALDCKVTLSGTPMHGQKMELKLDSYWQDLLKLKQSATWVQRYNSLAVFENPVRKLKGIKTIKYSEEIMALHGSHTLSFQFHPESVGTSFPKTYFRCLKEFFI